MQMRRRAGRPARRISPGERVPMSFRVTPELKERMDRAASASGRSVAQEIELRLENSFRDQEDVIRAALVLAYGPQLAALSQLIGDAARNTITVSNFFFSDESQTHWIDHPYTFEQVRAGIATLLDGLRPPGVPDVPKASRLSSGERIAIGPNAAKLLGAHQARSTLRDALSEGGGSIATMLGVKAAERGLAQLGASHQDDA
jgi:predicted DNA-binding protein